MRGSRLNTYIVRGKTKYCAGVLSLLRSLEGTMASGGYSNLGARGKNFQKFMLSEKKKKSDLGLDIFLPKSKCSLKKKKVFSPNRPLSESKTVYAVFEGGPPKKGGA